MMDTAFRQAVNVWITKPNVANKRIMGAKLLTTDIDECGVIERLLCTKAVGGSSLKEVISPADSNSLTFDSYDAAYKVFLDNSSIIVNVNDGGKHDLLTRDWLENELPKKLNLWYQQEREKPSNGASRNPSLRLIDIEQYREIYERLKTQYGKELAKNWSERTNPEKFVYEDIAIASYLMCLWSNDVKSKINFVDVGCGNGLLVYILVSEGFAGYGVDIRKRGIWGKYPANVQSALQERTLEPSDSNLFPDNHWIIGNHSDELTPWLPVLAAKSGPNCRVFLLPCCPHDFHGRFSAGSRGAGVSRYRAYLDYVTQIVETCGFQPEEDVLRIPSTKRVCIIGRTFTNRRELLSKIDEFIESRSILVDQGCQVDSEDDDEDKLGEQHRLYDRRFKPRAAVEPVRNCTNVDKGVRDQVCSLVFDRLLSQERPVITADGRMWNRGGVLKLSEVSSMLDSSLLKQLKSEHGGLQTMFRNHHQAFQVCGAQVELRLHEDKLSHSLSKPSPAKQSRQDQISSDQSRNNSKHKFRHSANSRLKTKLCWMLSNHPNGCPYLARECDFAHGESELVVPIVDKRTS